MPRRVRSLCRLRWPAGAEQGTGSGPRPARRVRSTSGPALLRIGYGFFERFGTV